MADIINGMDTWVNADYNPFPKPYLRLLDGQTTVSYCRSLTLRVVFSQHGYDRRQRWIIPEYKLDEAVRELKSDNAVFRRRYREAKMVNADVERIIRSATYGLVTLRMEE